jgi:hypothetical protein
MHVTPDTKKTLDVLLTAKCQITSGRCAQPDEEFKAYQTEEVRLNCMYSGGLIYREGLWSIGPEMVLVLIYFSLDFPTRLFNLR